MRMPGKNRQEHLKCAVMSHIMLDYLTDEIRNRTNLEYFQ